MVATFLVPKRGWVGRRHPPVPKYKYKCTKLEHHSSCHLPLCFINRWRRCSISVHNHTITKFLFESVDEKSSSVPNNDDVPSRVSKQLQRQRSLFTSSASQWDFR